MLFQDADVPRDLAIAFAGTCAMYLGCLAATYALNIHDPKSGEVVDQKAMSTLTRLDATDRLMSNPFFGPVAVCVCDSNRALHVARACTMRALNASGNRAFASSRRLAIAASFSLRGDLETRWYGQNVYSRWFMLVYVARMVLDTPIQQVWSQARSCSLH